MSYLVLLGIRGLLRTTEFLQSLHKLSRSCVLLNASRFLQFPCFNSSRWNLFLGFLQNFPFHRFCHSPERGSCKLKISNKIDGEKSKMRKSRNSSVKETTESGDLIVAMACVFSRCQGYVRASTATNKFYLRLVLRLLLHPV